MNTTDTSREAVERLVAEHGSITGGYLWPKSKDHAERVASTLTALLERSEKAERHVGNLLARIHRDGGQHEESVGTDIAVEQADKIVADVFAERDELRARLEAHETRWEGAIKVYTEAQQQLTAAQARVADIELIATVAQEEHLKAQARIQDLEAQAVNLCALQEALEAALDDPDYCARRPLVAAKGRAALAGSAQQVPPHAQSKPDKVSWVRNYRNENGCRLVDAIRQYDLLYGDSKSAQPSMDEGAETPRDSGTLRINFGIYRRVGRRRTESRCGKLTISGTWDDDETHKAIRAKIRELNPGWDLHGYCLSDSQSRKETSS